MGFEGSKEVRENRIAEDPERPPQLLHITTRTSNPKESARFYKDVMGMKTLSIQPVAPHGFDLYFYAWTNDIPPNTGDLKAVENREWAWQRNYTELEIQHVQGGPKIDAT